MEELIKLNQLLNSAKEAIVMKDKELNTLKRLNTTLEDEKKQWVEMKLIQDQVIQDTLSRINHLNNQYLEEIQTLKVEVNRLNNGNFN